MLRFEKILCPVDFSEYSVKAYKYARSLAQHYAANLLLQQVIQPLTSTCPCYAFPDPINEVFRNLETSAGQRRQESGHFTRGPVAGKVLRKTLWGARRWRAGGIYESTCHNLLN